MKKEIKENKVEMYLGYSVLWWNALLNGDFETAACYRYEMARLMNDMSTDEVLDTIHDSDILDEVYRSYGRQR